MRASAHKRYVYMAHNRVRKVAELLSGNEGSLPIGICEAEPMSFGAVEAP